MLSPSMARNNTDGQYFRHEESDPGLLQWSGNLFVLTTQPLLLLRDNISSDDLERTKLTILSLLLLFIPHISNIVVVFIGFPMSPHTTTIHTNIKKGFSTQI